MSRTGVIRVKPSCFKSNPTPQEAAENCCNDCPHVHECIMQRFEVTHEELEKRNKMTALSKQVGGNHYKDLSIQPVEYIHANGLGYFEGNVIKYITRWRKKNGIADLQKAKHYLELMIELENRRLDEGCCDAGKRD